MQRGALLQHWCIVCSSVRVISQGTHVHGSDSKEAPAETLTKAQGQALSTIRAQRHWASSCVLIACNNRGCPHCCVPPQNQPVQGTAQPFSILALSSTPAWLQEEEMSQDVLIEQKSTQTKLGTKPKEGLCKHLLSQEGN